jgi:putative ABC transport system permease protein
MRHLLIAGQVAVSMTFLISAGLLARGLIRSQSADPGFATATVYLTPLDFGKNSIEANARARKVIDRVQALPQVESAGIVERPPMMWTWTIGLRADGSGSAVSLLSPLANYVSAEYFPTLEIPLVRGRNFSRAEQRLGAPVAILSEATARTLWPNQDPIGKTIQLALDRTGKLAPFEVIGIASDVRTANLSRLDPAMVYLPEDSAHPANSWLVLRIHGEPRSALAAIGAVLKTVDVRFTSGFSPLNLEQDVVHTQRLVSSTLSLSAASLALLALLLAAVGIYGVASFVVSQREREVGIRMALGASAGDVIRLMVGDGMKPVLWGALVGLLGASAVAVVLKSTLAFPAAIDVLYGVNSFDPATFVGLALLLGAIAASACYLPARRAARIDPMVALRHE